MPTSEPHIAEYLLNKARSGRLAILAGAGVSMQAPSSLPSGSDLKTSVVNEILEVPVLRRSRSAILRHSAFSTALPELVFQELAEAIGDRLLPFFGVLQNSAPNLGHACLSHLATNFRVPVVTTNFDDLIERAKPQRCRVLHLHGTLRRPRTLMVRLPQVSRGMSRSVRRAFFREVRDRTLIVVGYSGNDVDILRELAASRVAEIVWVIRPADPAHPATRVAARLADHALRFEEADLGKLFKNLASRLRLAWLALPPHAVDALRVTRAKSASNAAISVPMHRRTAAAHSLLFFIGRYPSAASIALQAARERGCPTPDDTAWLLNGAADALRLCWKIPAALRTARRALELTPPAHNYYRSSAWNQIGLAQLERPRPQPAKAVAAFRSARRLLGDDLPVGRNITRETHRQFAARLNNNLGLALAEAGLPRPALSALRRSLRLKRRLGDLPGIATTLTNMLEPGFRTGVRWFVLKRWMSEADHLCQRFELRFRHAYLLRVSGELHCEAARVPEGLGLLRRAVQTSRKYPIHLRLAKLALAKWRGHV